MTGLSYVSPLRAIEELMDQFFYYYPTKGGEPKPPMITRAVYEDLEQGDIPNEDDKIKGFEIQLALAGFKPENIEVNHNGKTLHIKGNNNQHSYINEKFSCQFEKKFVVNDKMDLENIEAKLIDGILSVYIPLKTKPTDPELKIVPIKTVL